MSIHDKFFSDFNKNHIYNLLSKIIYDDFNINIKDDLIYKENFNNILLKSFDNNNFDELEKFNANVIDNFYNYIKNNKSNNINKLFTSISYNLYNFNLIFYDNIKYIEKIVIPILDNIIFEKPIIILNIKNKDYYYILDKTIKLNNIKYGYYNPINKYKLNIMNDININILNYNRDTISYSKILNIIDIIKEDEYIYILLKDIKYINNYIYLYNTNNDNIYKEKIIDKSDNKIKIKINDYLDKEFVVIDPRYQTNILCQI